MKTKRKAAMAAGVALIVMSVAAAFAYGYVHNTLFIAENPQESFTNLQSNAMLFGAEIITWLLILLCDLVVALALYFFFKKVNERLSAATALVRIFYSAILGFAIYFLSLIFGETNVDRIMFLLHNFENTWSIGLILFGLHLFMLGLLVIQSKSVPDLWGILLLFAAVSYSFVHSSKLFFPEFDAVITTVEMVLSIPMAVAEIGFAIWLLLKGGKEKTVYQSPKQA